MTATHPPPLSVVLISRNQRWNIDRLIESVHAAVEDGTEIVLVDSASTDGTPQAAAAHGIRVLRLHESQHLSPSAGRFIGFEHTSGRYTLFLDGDTALVPEWLPLAVSVLDADSGIAAVGGAHVSLPIGTDADTQPDPPEFTSEFRTVSQPGGSALHRRSALLISGQFDPFLYSDEEPDLAIRLRHHGYRLVRTEYPAIFDYTDPLDRISTLWGRRKRGLYLGAGQNLRKHYGQPTFSRYLRERGFGVLPLVGVPLYAAALAAAVQRGRGPVIGILGLPPLAFGLLTTRKGSPSKALHALVLRALIAEGTVRGLCLPVRDPESYTPLTKEITADT